MFKSHPQSSDFKGMTDARSTRLWREAGAWHNVAGSEFLKRDRKGHSVSVAVET